MRRGQPEKRDCARSEWPDVVDSLQLVGQEQGSDKQAGRESRPRQSAVGYPGERIQKRCVPDSPVAKHAVRHVLRTTWVGNLLEHWAVPVPERLGRLQCQGIRMGLQRTIISGLLSVNEKGGPIQVDGSY